MKSHNNGFATVRGRSILNNTALTKQWTAKWPYKANALFRIVKKWWLKIFSWVLRGAIAPLS